MSKYTYAPESADWDYKQYIITVIANELAEANRLKRLELLKTKLPYSDSEISNWKKELGDQS